MRVSVPTCEAYRECWGPFHEFIRRSWPDCPYVVDLLPDTKELGWCSSVAFWCEHIEDDFVLMILDDHWIDGKVDTKAIVAMEKWIRQSKDIGCIRLHPSPGVQTNMEWGVHPIGQPYRCSTAPSIWRVSYLKEIAETVSTLAQSAQHFEAVGTAVANGIPMRVIAPREDYIPLPFINSAIVKGKWHQGALDRAKSLGIAVDTSGREMLK